METGAYSEELKSQGRSVSDMGDPMLLPLQGGIPVVDPSDGTVLGGIGVGGLPTGKADEDISRVGLKALGFELTIAPQEKVPPDRRYLLCYRTEPFPRRDGSRPLDVRVSVL